MALEPVGRIVVVEPALVRAGAVDHDEAEAHQEQDQKHVKCVVVQVK